MTSYLTITDGARARRVDFGMIGELFAEEEPAAVASPRWIERAAAALQKLGAKTERSIGMLRRESEVRRARDGRVARVFSV